MAVGSSDWADTGTRVQTTRSSAAARPSRSTAASDRADIQSRARFGEALSTARSRDAAVSRATAARGTSPSRDTHAEIAARETGVAHRKADDTPAGRRGESAPTTTDAVRRGRADDTARSDPADTSQKPGVTADASGTAKAGDTTKAGDAKAAKPATDPSVPATGEAAAVPAPQPTLIALLAALTGGGADAAGPEGAAKGAAAGGQSQGATGAIAASPIGAAVATAVGPATPQTQGPPGTPQAGGDPASPTDGAAIAEAVHGKPQAEVSEGGAKPDFLAALTDASRDAVPNAGGQDPVAAPATSAASGATHAASAAAPAAQADAASQAAPAIQIGQVPVTIGLRSLQGSSEFQIRLDPAELGRIEVKLEIDKARGTVMTHLVVDRPDTLAMLQRDAGQLQQALSQAGLDASSGVGVSLRGDGGAQNGSGSDARDRPRGDGAWTAETSEPVQGAAPMRALRGYGGLDIRI